MAYVLFFFLCFAIGFYLIAAVVSNWGGRCKKCKSFRNWSNTTTHHDICHDTDRHEDVCSRCGHVECTGLTDYNFVENRKKL